MGHTLRIEDDVARRTQHAESMIRALRNGTLYTLQLDPGCDCDRCQSGESRRDLQAALEHLDTAVRELEAAFDLLGIERVGFPTIEQVEEQAKTKAEGATTEVVSQLLVELRNCASLGFTLAVRDDDQEVEEDMRAVWHTCEIALGVLVDGYYPKREAVADVRDRLADWDG